MCKERICSVEGCQETVKAKGLCNKHYLMAKRGKLESSATFESKKARLKEIADKTDYSLTKNINSVGKTSKIVITAFDNGTQNIIDKSSDFITKDGNMRIRQLMSKECLHEHVDPQYYVYASLIVSWAINSKDCIVRNPNVDNKLVANDMMIKDLFTKFAPKQKMADRKYKEVINHLIERNVIYKTTRITPLSKETVVYLANPLFVPSILNELSPELFLSFHDMLATRIDERTMNEMFGLALKSICWSSECEAYMLKGRKEEAYAVLTTNLKNTVRTLGLGSRVIIVENQMDFLLNALGCGETVDQETEEEMIIDEDVMFMEDIVLEARQSAKAPALFTALKEGKKNKPSIKIPAKPDLSKILSKQQSLDVDCSYM